MMTTEDMTDKAFADLGAPDLVYVREVAASEIMDEVAGATDPDQPPIRLDPRQTLYAVHSADGERLAVMADRESAFAAAVAHELEPVSVH